MLELILFGDDCSNDDLRNKNIRQTELLVDLREAILQVGRHFQVSRFYVFLCRTYLAILEFGLSSGYPLCISEHYCLILFKLASLILLAFFTLVCHVLQTLRQ